MKDSAGEALLHTRFYTLIASPHGSSGLDSRIFFLVVVAWIDFFDWRARAGSSYVHICSAREYEVPTCLSIFRSETDKVSIKPDKNGVARDFD